MAHFLSIENGPLIIYRQILDFSSRWIPMDQWFLSNIAIDFHECDIGQNKLLQSLLKLVDLVLLLEVSQMEYQAEEGEEEKHHGDYNSVERNTK